MILNFVQTHYIVYIKRLDKEYFKFKFEFSGMDGVTTLVNIYL